MPISRQALPGIPYDDSGKVLIVQREKLLKSAVSDYIDRIVNRRGPRQRVITQPRPICDISWIEIRQCSALPRNRDVLLYGWEHRRGNQLPHPLGKKPKEEAPGST